MESYHPISSNWQVIISSKFVKIGNGSPHSTLLITQNTCLKISNTCCLKAICAKGDSTKIWRRKKLKKKLKKRL
jgi:hypothetical protein